MEQYKQDGIPAVSNTTQNHDPIKRIQDLENRIVRQDRLIAELQQDFRRLRNSMRTAIATVNTVNSNRQRNG